MKKGQKGQVHLPNTFVHGLKGEIVKVYDGSIRVKLLYGNRLYRKGETLLLRKWEFHLTREETDGTC
jgi:hypothetical protein